MKYLFLISIIFFISCSGTPPKEKATCATTNPMGTCENDTDYCYKGNCIPTGSECVTNQILAPCADKNYICKEINEEFVCQLRNCSFSYPTGACPENQMCVEGECKNICSATAQTGVCEESGYECIDGECILSADKCTSVNSDGKCPTGKICSNGECKNECSQANTSGACVFGKKCMDGECLTETEICGTLKPNGLCSTGKICKDYNCKFACSEEQLTGVCSENTKICYEGSCQLKCSVEAQDGICTQNGFRCIVGKCTPPCSQDEYDGYCEDVDKCMEGVCISPCSQTELNGYCDEDQSCKSGICKFECSSNHQDGYCNQNNHFCVEGVCVNACSPTNLTGPCERSDFYCDSDTGTCVEYPCSSRNTDGPCNDPNKVCYQGRCRNACSETNLTGFCQNTGWFCKDGVCVDPATQPCSVQAPNGICQEHYHCEDGICKEDPCSVDYEGVCPLGEECIQGICRVPTACADGRTFDHVFGSCCLEDDDCVPLNPDMITVGQICIFTSNTRQPEGPYCMTVKLGSFNGMPLAYPQGGCSNDAHCNDPYPANGTEQQYFCNQLYYYEESINQLLDLRFCQQVFNGCQAITTRDKDAGENCNDNCHDGDCKYGLHCFHGFCTNQCNSRNHTDPYNASDCPIIPGTQIHFDCLSEDYELSDFNKSYSVDVCLNACKSNSDCLVPNTWCNDIAYLRTGERTFVCDNRGEGDTWDKGLCTVNENCFSNICDLSNNKCSNPCDDDTDCGLNAYCSFDFPFMLENEISQWFGTCKYMDNSSTNMNLCSHTSDCNPGYECIPKFTKDDNVVGICSIVDQTYYNYANIGEECTSPNNKCVSDICDNENICREYCEETSQCGENSICKLLKVRGNAVLNGVEFQPELWTGACLPKNGSMQNCVNSSVYCSNSNETCIFNASKRDITSAEVEYICVEKSAGNAFNTSCTADSQCQSGICHPTGRYCTIACNSENQCSDIGHCNAQGYIIFDSDNPDKIVYGGICER